MTKSFQEMNDEEFQEAIVNITNTSTTDEEIRNRLYEEVKYPHKSPYKIIFKLKRKGEKIYIVLLSFAPSGKTISTKIW